MMALTASSASATTISIVRFETRDRSSEASPCSCIPLSFTGDALATSARREDQSCGDLLPGREEARVLHEPMMALFCRLDPLRVLVAGHERVVEGALLHELL